MVLSLVVFFFVTGLSIGSFINMAAYRIPAQLSIITPRSYCNNCKDTLPLRALIPLVGYFITHAQCRKCKMKIPLEYPLVELLCGLFFVFAFIYYDGGIYLPYSFSEYCYTGLLIHLLTACWLFSSGLLLSIIDLKHQILPDIIVIPGILINLVLGTLNPDLGFIQSLLGAFVGGFGLFSISKIYELFRKREGIGFGDVKYLAFLGAILGVYGVLFTIFLASILGSVIGISVLLIKRKNLHTPIPFGPFLAVSGLIYFLLSKNFAVI